MSAVAPTIAQDAPIGIAVLGAPGRMGRSLILAILDAEAAGAPVRLAGATDRPGSEWIGRDVGDLVGVSGHGVSGAGVVVEDDPLPVFARVDAVIDFTSPDATVAHAELSAQARLIHVIGTTGFDAAHLCALDAAAPHATLIRAGNMSLGVNLLTLLVEKIAKALDEDFDVEVVEAHHGRKVDAPSGTALMLGEAAAKGRGVSLEEAADRGRDGVTGARRRGAIGFSAIRGGDIVGEHDVIFAGPGERVVVRHVATDRQIFARGAVKAALWGRGKPPGAYDMVDVLGLR